MLSFFVFKKVFVNNARDRFSQRFVETLMLKGGLKQVIFRFRVLFFLSFISTRPINLYICVVSILFVRLLSRRGGACFIEYLRIFRIGR